MHQFDDNLFPHQPRQSLLSQMDINERVYPEFRFKSDPELAVEPVDEYFERMSGRLQQWDENIWLLDEEEEIQSDPCHFKFTGISPLEEDRMGEEVATFLSNLGNIR
tara:strand:- start:5889 stop:6209 length:321 start_codon:yes stop_codon:yes gene_type:complete